MFENHLFKPLKKEKKVEHNKIVFFNYEIFF